MKGIETSESWKSGTAATAAGEIPLVQTRLLRSDILNGWKARWGMGRMDYRVVPGLYGVGRPDKTSHVLVTANYKLTFDALRRELDRQHLWILVLDTRGINVWCAAGKGTFGTEELVRRIQSTGLERVVRHRRLILPQLGAPGVSAAEVARQTGFHVNYGPVRASDLPAFLSSGCKATPEMRRVRFSAWDRLVLSPVEAVQAVKTGLPVLGGLFVALMVGLIRFDSLDFLALVGSWLAGCLVTPVLLPWIPGRAFAWKGFVAGLAVTAGLMAAFAPAFVPSAPDALWRGLSWLFLYPALSAFFAMNFTGSSTYTSFSGVLREMRTAVPLMIASIALGVLGLVVGRFA